jgi:hypothetical protein
MDNILESMFLLELDRLETKNCLACSTAALADNGSTPRIFPSITRAIIITKQQLNNSASLI